VGVNAFVQFISWSWFMSCSVDRRIRHLLLREFHILHILQIHSAPTDITLHLSLQWFNN